MGKKSQFDVFDPGKAVAIDGVELRSTDVFSDARGWVSVAHRASDEAGRQPVVQWNVSGSVAGVMRGVHAHRLHHDWLVAVSGVMQIGLHDLRRSSATYGASTVVHLNATSGPSDGLVIPPGVAHGFYSVTESVHVYGTDTYWSPSDELGCRWDDPDLGLQWALDAAAVQLSERDRGAGTFAQLLALGW